MGSAYKNPTLAGNSQHGGFVHKSYCTYFSFKAFVIKFIKSYKSGFSIIVFDGDVVEDIVIFGKKWSVSCVVSRICVNGSIILSQIDMIEVITMN